MISAEETLPQFPSFQQTEFWLDPQRCIQIEKVGFHLKCDRIRSIRTMIPRRHSQLVAMILVAMSIVAFTPRVLHPHVRLSCGSTEGTTFSGPQRFTDDSSRVPDLQAGYEVNGVPLRQNLKLIWDDQKVKPFLSFGFMTPSVRPLVRPPKLLPSRAESQDPL